MSRDLESLVAELTLEEKVALVGGADVWHTAAIERLAIPAVKVTDGPAGARGDGVLASGPSAACFPCGAALGATWNPDLVERIGAAMGRESHTKAAHVLLAPTINLHRSPLGGRNFECYSEDPLLSGRIAAAFVRGVQSEGVATTPKHFVGNDSEFERNTINAVIGERALRELYLLPFELAVKEGGAWGLMTAYNRLNGPFCAENRWLLDDVLRGEWGFDGFIVSDWFGTKSTVESANAGLDLEMPGPPLWYDEKLVDAVKEGDVDGTQLDAMVKRILRLAERTGGFDGIGGGPETSVDRPEDRVLAAEAAAEAMVLLKNDGAALPLPVDELRTVAIIGPNADRCQMMGGGSAALNPHYSVTPLEALETRLGASAEVVFEAGCTTDKTIPPLRAELLTTPGGERGVAVELFAGEEPQGDPFESETRPNTRLMWFGETVGEGFSFSARATTILTPRTTGAHRFSLIEVGLARLFVDGDLVLDGWRSDLPRSDAFFGVGSEELTADVDLVAAQPVEIVIEYSSREAVLFRAVTIGCREPEPPDQLERAVRAAEAADVAIVIVGTNDDWETEGNDRETMHLPGRSDELVAAVAAANERTIVVVNAGSPVAMPWVDAVPAILDIWFTGQGMAEALADVVVGDVEPGGRLPTTFPRRLEDSPAFLNYPGENGEVEYGEGIFVGYRGFDRLDREPLFPFGHGLGYTTIDIGDGRMARTRVDPDDGVTVTVPVHNRGDRAGVVVVQCYVRPVDPRLGRPPQELKAFAKVALDPGEQAEVELALDRRSFSYWDPGVVAEPRPGPIPRGGRWRTEPGWYADPGEYEIAIGTSSRAISWTGRIELTG